MLEDYDRRKQGFLNQKRNCSTVSRLFKPQMLYFPNISPTMKASNFKFGMETEGGEF